ncbi:MAG: hypothetical protein SVU69_03055 [Pseudomonadota bacterium]|nr:hypothetical protein [Pseudomonadota bacterium]
MTTHTQELLALTLVAVVVAFFLWRRFGRGWSHPSKQPSGCGACHRVDCGSHPPAAQEIHFLPKREPKLRPPQENLD